MDIVKFQKLGQDIAPRTTEDAIYPNIDDSYTIRSYTGERLAIRTSQTYGIKGWGSGMPQQYQGMAVYGNILVRARSATTGHKIFQIGTNGSLTELASFDLDLSHGNALQFAPELEAGQTFPYLYVAGLSGKCYVLSIASDYTVTLVQTITAAGQVLIGDDGYIWASIGGIEDDTRLFRKYRKVKVSEGTEVTLVAEEPDLLDYFYTTDKFPSASVTAQGWKVKFGKVWFCYGQGGSSQLRGISVYDTDSHRHIATIDTTSYASTELEDIEFYNNALIIATFASDCYMLRF